MNKEDFVRRLAPKIGKTQAETNFFVSTFFGELREIFLKEETLSLRELGIFRVAKHRERKGVNPKTRELTTFPATKIPKFNVSDKLKKELNTKSIALNSHK